ncbi:MAG: hypothetical protein ABW221_23540 [Vicinamibacteria bacterium]
MRSLASLAVALMTLAVPLAAHAGGLSTAPPNNGSGGVFLDLTPSGAAVLFDSFETPTNAAPGAAIQVEVWTRPGSYVGFTTSNAGWTLTQTVSGTGGATTSTPVPFTLTPSITLLAGTTTGVYLHGITAGGGLRYTGTGAAPPQTTWSTADLTLFSDVARTGAVAFAGTQFTPRTFSGNILYSTTPVTLESFEIE